MPEQHSRQHEVYLRGAPLVGWAFGDQPSGMAASAPKKNSSVASTSPRLPERHYLKGAAPIPQDKEHVLAPVIRVPI